MTEMKPEDLPDWLVDLTAKHEPLEGIGGYTECECGWNVYGRETITYNEHLLAAVLPDLKLDFVAKASARWKSVDYGPPPTPFNGGRVVRYTVAEIKKELLERYDRGEL